MGTRLIVAGGRNFTNYELLKQKLDFLLQNVPPPIEIVSGRCDTGTHTFTTNDGIKVYGCDGLGEKYAAEKGYSVKPFPADWDTYGKSAGPIRNRQMAEYGTHCVCFWDGKSRGTKSMIELCAQYGISCRVVRF